MLRIRSKRIRAVVFNYMLVGRAQQIVNLFLVRPGASLIASEYFNRVNASVFGLFAHSLPHRAELTLGYPLQQIYISRFDGSRMQLGLSVKKWHGRVRAYCYTRRWDHV